MAIGISGFFVTAAITFLSCLICRAFVLVSLRVYEGIALPKGMLSQLGVGGLTARAIAGRPSGSRRSPKGKAIVYAVRLCGQIVVFSSLLVVSSIAFGDEPPITECDRLMAMDQRHMTAQQQQSASKSCTASLEQYPGNSRLIFNLAQTHIMVGDFGTALDLLHRDLDKGYAPAMDAMGTMYLNGWGVQTNLRDAVSWFRKAADGGNADGEYHLGTRYWMGQGVPLDQTQGVSWFRKSAAQGKVQAMVLLARAYASGRGVAQNSVEAVHWFRLAAEQGDAGAQCNLGEMYYHGTGVDGNEQLALEWFQKAANQGLPEAKAYVAAIDRRRNPFAEDPNSRTTRPDREVRISAPKARVTGDTVQPNDIATILFTSEPCQLPLDDTRGMHRAWMPYGAFQLGCWYPTIDGNYVFVGQIPSLSHKASVAWQGLPRALLHSNGSATITEPNYDSTTFMSNIMSKKAFEVFDHTHERP